MKIKKIIGYGLFLIAIWLISYSYLLKKGRFEAFLKASEEVLLKVDGQKSGKVGEFQISYRFAHGILIQNAELIENKEDYESANIKVTQNENIVYLRFKNGKKIVEKGNKWEKCLAEVILPFEGQVIFGNQLCGCENFGPEVFFLGSCVVGFIFSIVGFLFLKDMTFW